MEPTGEEVLAAVSQNPCGIGDLGLAIVIARDLPVPEEGAIGQRLAAAGLSLSALQKVVDLLVGDGQLKEVRGRELWDLNLPTEGTKAMGRYYLQP